MKREALVRIIKLDAVGTSPTAPDPGPDTAPPGPARFLPQLPPTF